MMMYGRDINLPPAMARGPVPDQRAPRLPESDYPAWLHSRLQDLHHSVRERADTLSWSMKQRYNIRAKRPEYTAGSSVWLFDPRRRVGKPPKLESWWAGPYVVEAMLNDVVA
ncbi:Anamorsin [Frankliniella fusca]|uniref:Anamorsin n=1 Tax=Frankliniella fusca TaxID=407009 RepID=A0AAE1L831_9NEOP|nr:Anamorsin [Frankliniella fusca]